MGVESGVLSLSFPILRDDIEVHFFFVPLVGRFGIVVVNGLDVPLNRGVWAVVLVDET